MSFTPPAHTSYPWVDLPVTSTPVDATNLGAFESGLANDSRAVVAAYDTYAENRFVHQPSTGAGVPWVYNVRDYGATGDGTTDDTTAIQAAINAAFGTGIAQQATIGGTVYFPPGTYICQGLVLKSGVHLRGSGTGGNVYSDTDANLPPVGTFLKLKPSSTQDLIVTDNFAALNATPSSATAYNTPERCSIHDMVLDGNRFGASGGGRCASLFVRGLVLENVIFQNAAGADGVYLNGPTGSGETEVFMRGFRIENCVGNGLNIQGAHDLMIMQGIINNNGGIGVIEGLNTGSLQMTSVHAYSSGSYNWQLGSAGQPSHVNCVSDGSPGVQILTNGQQWYGGAIYGVGNAFDELICLGDGTTRTVRGCVFITPIFQWGTGARIFRYRTNTTVGYNKFISNANLQGNSPNTMFAADGYGIASGPIASTATTITLNTVGTAFVNGTTVVVTDGTHVATAAISSGGGTGTLTLSAQLGTAMNTGTNNIAVWQRYGTFTGAYPPDTFELSDANSGGTGFYQQQSNASGTSTRMNFDNLQQVGKFNVGDGQGHVRGAIYSVSGAPTFSATAGDFAFRIDTPTIANQRLYVCTGGTSWTAIL